MYLPRLPCHFYLVMIEQQRTKKMPWPHQYTQVKLVIRIHSCVLFSGHLPQSGIPIPGSKQLVEIHS